MVCGKFLDTGKILLGEEENKTKVLWLNRHSSRWLGYVCTSLHLCCSVQRITFNQLHLLVSLVILWPRTHQLGHSPMNVSLKPYDGILVLYLTVLGKINSYRRRRTHCNMVALDFVVLELRNVRIRASAQLK